MTSKPKLKIAGTAEAMSREAARIWIDTARDAIAKRGRFSVALSGGSTPRRLYEILGQEMRDAIDWSKVDFFWGDERVVPPEHEESNFRLARKAMLDPLGVPEQSIHRFRTDLPEQPGTIARLYEEELRKHFGKDGRFDLILMGLGHDGHTASLFPELPATWKEKGPESPWVIAPWVPHLNAYRLTLTPEIINRARKVLFVVSGMDKALVLKKVLERNSSQVVPSFPAQAIQPEDGEVIWVTDAQAGSLVSNRQQVA
jgi:6-phosphogluconolactonase